MSLFKSALSAPPPTVCGGQEDKKASFYNQSIGVETPTYNDSSHFTPHSSHKYAAFTLAEVFHPLRKSRKIAFTLAEVLITLGIIGIVAALTMPALISKYNMKVYETAFKKQYSAIQNSINFSSLINGYTQCYMYYPADTIYYHIKTDDCEGLQNDLITQMKLTQINTSVKNNYARKAEISSNGGESINWGCSYDHMIHTAYPYMTNDGAIIMFRMDVVPLTVILDVNGEKGPNKWGYDVFFMTLSNHNEKTNRILLTDEYCSIVEKGGKFPRTILKNQEINGDISGWIWK